MNIVNTLTLRHIKSHTKRSVLTILAIIVSVAMVTAVFTSALSFVNYFKNVAKAVDGSWHTYINTDDYLGNKESFVRDDIEKTGIELCYGVGTFTTSDNKITVDINACDEGFLELRNVIISEGRMPTNTSEMLVHRRFVEKNKLDWKIGDIITMPVEFYDADNNYKEDRSLTIVGFTDSNVAETDFINAFVYATDDFIKASPNTSVYVKYADLNNKIFEDTGGLASSIGSNVFGYNNMLLTYSGISNGDETIYTLAAFCSIILLIIAIVSIFIIYDSFAVSYQERARYLGMLASVGATKRQKRNSIYFEGLILGLIGVPLGILAGIGGIWITFKAINDVWTDTLAVEYDGVLTVSVNWIVILGTIIASAITIFVSSYIPALKASKTSAIDAIRQANTVKVKKAKRLRTSKLATKLLGYEGALAIKNYKRNGRRSKTIVFALVMSVVVFLSVSNFSLMFSGLMNQNYSMNADLMVSVEYPDAQKLDTLLNKTDGIERQFGIDYEYCQFDTSLIKDEHKSTFSNDRAIVAFVDNNTLDSYLNQLGEDTSKYHDVNNPRCIIHNSVVTRDEKKKIKIHPLVDLTGKEFETSMTIFDDDPNAEKEIITINPTVGIQTTEDYKDDMFVYQDMHLPLVLMSIDLEEQYYSQSNNIATYYTANIVCDGPDELQEYLENSELNTDKYNGYTIYNSTSEMNAINNILTIVKVFVFGFITLITLISILNIINTISNSMNERRREFAMIRSVGMTPKSFKKMVYYESFRYGLISLLLSIPISIGIHYIMYYVLSKSYDYGFKLNVSIYIIAIVAVFAIISVALFYSISKIKDDNIIETLKQDIN